MSTALAIYKNKLFKFNLNKMSKKRITRIEKLINNIKQTCGCKRKNRNKK